MLFRELGPGGLGGGAFVHSWNASSQMQHRKILVVGVLHSFLGWSGCLGIPRGHCRQAAQSTLAHKGSQVTPLSFAPSSTFTPCYLGASPRSRQLPTHPATTGLRCGFLPGESGYLGTSPSPSLDSLAGPLWVFPAAPCPLCGKEALWLGSGPSCLVSQRSAMCSCPRCLATSLQRGWALDRETPVLLGDFGCRV